MRRQLTLLVLTVLSVYLLMVVGAYVTTGNYGLSCPDWPTCNGSLTPPLNWGVMAEYGHRLLTVLATVFVFATTYSVSRARSDLGGVPRLMQLASLLLIFQIALGAVVVASDLDAVISTVHLANSIVIFGLVTASLALARERGSRWD